MANWSEINSVLGLLAYCCGVWSATCQCVFTKQWDVSVQSWLPPNREDSRMSSSQPSDLRNLESAKGSMSLSSY
jgi:hypothetical protein